MLPRNPDLRSAAALTVAALLTAALPAGAESAAGSDEADLRARVEAYWQAKVARSQEMFSFYTPPEKGGLPRDQVAGFSNIHYRDYELDEIHIEGDRAAVTGTITLGTLGSGVPPTIRQRLQGETRTVRSLWERVDGTWYHVPPRKVSLYEILGARGSRSQPGTGAPGPEATPEEPEDAGETRSAPGGQGAEGDEAEEAERDD